MQSKKKLRYIFLLYWFLLSYVVACLIWWFIILISQNEQMTALKIRELNPGASTFTQSVAKIKEAEKKRNQF